jgi:hypothetical protein
MVLFINILGLLFLISSLSYFLGLYKYYSEPPIAQLSFGLVFTILTPVTTYYRANNNFNSAARLKEMITYTFTGEMIYINGESFKTEMTWDKLYKIQELNNWILIYTNNITANIIHKGAFSDAQLNTFREMVSKLKTTKIKLKK